jgi:hypothetical protein
LHITKYHFALKKSFVYSALLTAFSFFSEVNAQKASGTAISQKEKIANQIYHHTPDGRTYFELSGQKILIKFAPEISLEEQARILSEEKMLMPITKEMALPAPKVLMAELQKGATEKEILALIEKLNAVPQIEYANPFLIYQDGTSEAALDRFFVKLKDRSDFGKMDELVKSYGATIDEQYKYDPNLFFIKVTKNSKMRSLEMANQFAETGLFVTAEPDMLKLLKRYNTNDPNVGLQWSLNNTGSSAQYNGVNAGGTIGADMKVFSAWGISTGSSTLKVAILDEGVDLVHPDLVANLLPGFDGTGLGSNGGPSGNDAHGTACAGIVAAVGNNNTGLAGVAYGCKIIPVRIAYSSGTSWVTSNSVIGTSLDWAWNQGGADVLSNSWGGGSSSTLINDPITRAVTQGRGGKGSPVLFAAGNSNGANSYPATLSNVVSVVAMSMCNQRKNPSSCDQETWWGSNFGTGVDVSAPGVKIYTCDISGSAGYSTGNYTGSFNGTSSACPNAAGVMALILSVNPNLTNAQARQILESSCDKVGGYTYNSNVSGQPNGTWSTDLGHGRVNAFTALQLANPQPCTTPTVGGTATGPASFASGSNGTFVLTGSNGTNIQWQASSNGGTSYSDIGGATNATSAFTLAGGTYLIRAAVSRINCTVSYSNVLNLTVTSPVGDVLGNPIIISSFPFSTTVSNASGFTNAYTGTNNQASADLFFRFTTGPCTDSMTVSTCASAFDTYLHLLNSSGTWISSNDDNGPLCTGTRASMKFLVSPNTTYFIVAEGYGTATGSIVLSINQRDNPVFTTNITAGGPLTFCQGGSVVLTAGAGSSYLWSNGATTPSITVNSSGNYSVTVSNANGCAASASSTVTVNPNPTVFNTSGGGSYCTVPGTGTSVNLSGSQTGVSYEFKFTAGGTAATVSGTGSGLTATGITGVGTITVLATNSSTGCFANMNGSASVIPQAASLYFRDQDGDGFGDAGNSTQACSTPIGYVSNNTDCDDNNSAVNVPQSFFVDADNDGFGSTATAMLCSATAPTGYSSNNTDCDDNNSAINAPQSYFVDADNDGFGSTATAMLCSTSAPAGYSSNNTDCDDNNSAINAPQSYFVDADNDGFGSTTTAMLCSTTAPAGYSTNSLDCNDGNANENPSQTEVCGNGIDDNCNGQIDENCIVYVFYQDADADGFGNLASFVSSNNPTVPSGYVTNSTDCNDAVFAINPAATEVCNGIDDNCDGTIDNGIPALPASTVINGPAGVCRNSTNQVFSTPAIAGASSYIWTLPAGATGSSTTNSITVSFSSTYVTGNICVRASNSCGQATNFCRSVIYYSARPGTPVSISGTTGGACSASTRTFTTASVANATSYNWTAPANASIQSGQGSSSVVVEFLPGFVSGSLSVTASNCAGTSTARTLALSSSTAVPTSITGPLNTVCAGSTQTYTSSLVSGATVYTWTVPANAIINSGQGTNSISVKFPSPFTSGSVTVKSGTACFTSSARSITVQSVPTAPTSITGAINGVCNGTTQTYSCPLSTTGGTSYNWTIPAGSVINSGQGTNSISLTLPAAYTSGTLSVTASNACGTSTLRSTTIRSNPVQPGTISGQSSNLCGGGTFSYSIAAVAGTTSYTWTVPAGYSILADNGTNISLSVPSGFTSGTLSVIASNACGNSIARTLPLSRLPTTPGTITGPTSVCPSATGISYTLVGTPGLTYTWTLPSGGTVVTGQGTAAITANWGTFAGNVSVRAANACGNSSSSRTLAVSLLPCRQVIEDEIDAEKNEVSLSVFPNPGTGKFVLKTKGITDGDQLMIFDLLGKKVMQKTLHIEDSELDINLVDVPAGAYFFRFEGKDLNRSIKVVKN